jgi:hypothetical protein
LSIMESAVSLLGKKKKKNYNRHSRKLTPIRILNPNYTSAISMLSG